MEGKKNKFLEIKNKDNRFRCKRTTGLTTFFSENDELIIKNWIISCRKKYAPVSTKSLVCYVGNINLHLKPNLLKSNYDGHIYFWEDTDSQYEGFLM